MKKKTISVLTIIIALVATTVYFLAPKKIQTTNINHKTLVASHIKDICNISETHPAFSYQNQISEAISTVAIEENLDPKLLISVIAVESRCIASAKSHRGARGLMQVMPATAKYMGVTKISTIDGNIRAGAKYLSYLYEKYNGNITFILAAYNAGPARVNRHRGIPPIRETQSYVKKVLKHYKTLQEKNITREV